LEQANGATDNAGSSVRGLMAGAAGPVAHHGSQVDWLPIRADAGSGIEDTGRRTAATYGSWEAADKAAAAGNWDGLPGGQTEVASGAAAGAVTIPGPASAAATPDCKEARSCGATAEDGTAPAGGDGPAADESDGRPVHHCSNLGQGQGPIPSAPVSLPSPCGGGGVAYPPGPVGPGVLVSRISPGGTSLT
jgi:hypothetical protein